MHIQTNQIVKVNFSYEEDECKLYSDFHQLVGPVVKVPEFKLKEDLLYSAVFAILCTFKDPRDEVYSKIDSLHIEREPSSHHVISISIISLIELELND